MAEKEENLTVLLNRASAGDWDARERAWRTVYAEVHAMARGVRHSYAGGIGHNRQADQRSAGGAPSADTIVHEAFLKAFGGLAQPTWENRAHFFGSLARAMAQFLVDWRRTQGRQKRGGGTQPMLLGENAGAIPSFRPLSDFDRAIKEMTPQLLAELDRLQMDAPDFAAVVWLRYVSGLGVKDTAQVLGIGDRTVTKRWNLGRALLRVRLAKRIGMDNINAESLDS